jgi:hypothetical protein
MSQQIAKDSRAVLGIAVAVLLLGIAMSLGASWGAALRSPRGTGKTARGIVRQLLQNPAQLRLEESPTSKRTFFFRIEIHWRKPEYRFSMLVACKSGKVAIVTYDRNGRVYSYYTSGLFVIVDARHPGVIDVFRRASMVLDVGGRAGGVQRLSTFGFAMSPVLDSPAKALLDLSGPLRSALVRPTTWCGFQSVTNTAIFCRKDGTLSFRLAKPKSAFPVQSVVSSNPKSSISLPKIKDGSQPLVDLFGVSLASLKASGQHLRIRNYQLGERLPWFPPSNFGSNQGEILASDALDRLMPIDENRVRVLDEHLINRQISALRHSGNSDYGPKSGMLPLAKIFSTLEWGPHNAVDFHAQRIVLKHGHPVVGYLSWKFNRIAYHKLLEKTWGTAEVDRLVGTLAGVALSKDRGLAQKFVAVDLLSDIGPGKADRQWTKGGDTVSKVFAGHADNGRTSSLLLGLIRARWGLPVGAESIAVAKRWLVNSKVNIPLRMRALEILCFTGQLPDDRHRIAKLLKMYLGNPTSCITSPISGRYLYDMSLCRTGRKILLGELVDRKSQLSGEPLLLQAAFNDALPGSPGINLAVKTARELVHNPKYSSQVRRYAFGEMCHAPTPVFRKFMLKQFGENAKHFGMRMESSLTSRKATAYFIPQLADLFARGDHNDKVRILEAIGYGFARGSDADVAAPLIRSALQDADVMVRWEGVACIGDLKYVGAKLGIAQFYSMLLHLVKDDFKGDLWKEVNALNCFSLATKGRWKMPAAGMMPYGLPNLQPNSGLTWWQQHYVAVHAHALAWAARHKVR